MLRSILWRWWYIRPIEMEDNRTFEVVIQKKITKFHELQIFLNIEKHMEKPKKTTKVSKMIN